MARVKVLLDYDTDTGQIYSPDGVSICAWSGLTPYTQGLTVEQVAKLKAAGFEAEEIIELHRKEVIR